MRTTYSIFCLIFLGACASSRHLKNFTKVLDKEINIKPVLSEGHTGFILIDAQTGQKVYGKNEQKRYIPASNTKILTLWAALEILGDSIPSIQYFTEKNAMGELFLKFRGTGDPTLLHPKFAAWQPAFNFLLKSDAQLVLLGDSGNEPRFGPGWAWDDFNYAFQTEKNALPVHANAVGVKNENGKLHIFPSSFKDQFFFPVMAPDVEEIERLEAENLWGLNRPPAPNTIQIKPIYQPSPQQLLGDTLHKIVDAKKLPDDYLPKWTTIKSCPIDTVLRRMMHQSDNFVAEQLLLACAHSKFGLCNSEKIIRWVVDSTLDFMPQKFRWVDGSGLSRYNLNSPENMAKLLANLWKKQDKSRLFDLFPAGGRSGTIAQNFNKKAEKPYVFAKTGSMSGVYCLSGYLVAKSGRVLIFSFMENNFIGNNQPVRQALEDILDNIYDRL